MVSFKGYVLEKPRVGSANSPFTSSPDNVVSDSGDYSSVYGVDESDPGRTEYLLLSLVDGDLADAEFGWTKNEDGVQRFDYDAQDQRFRPLPGAPREVVGVLAATSNTTRLTVTAPTASSSVAPFRVSVGSIASGTTFLSSTVATDASFTTPLAGHVQISLSTGNLNWRPSDLTANAGKTVYFQRQSFYGYKESTGRLGLAEDVIVLNPIPGNGQKPLVRFGFGLYLTSVSVSTEGSFAPNPVQGTFEWAQDTGRVRFNSSDLTANAGEPVYYDGALFETGRTVSRETLGTVASPSAISALPSDGADLVFRAKKSGAPTGTATFPTTSTLQDGSASFISSKVQVGDIVALTSGTYSGARRKVTAVVSATQLRVAPPFPSVSGATYKVEKKADIHQFAESERVADLASPGKADTVQVDDSGAVLFSDADQDSYGAYTAEVVIGDLLLERGISMRLFRTPVDLSATDPDLKDVSTFFPVDDATLADPIIGQPSVFLPVLPLDDAAYPSTFHVKQGTGSFTGDLPRLDVGNPSAGIGYTLDFDNRQLFYAVRRNNQIVSLPSASAAAVLPDPLVLSSNVVLELNQGAGFVTLTEGVDAVLEPTSGVVTFVSQQGTSASEGSNGAVASFNTLTDTSANFVSDGVVTGDFLVLPTGPLEGVYNITAITATNLLVAPNFPSTSTSVQYQVRHGKEILADRFFQQIFLVDRKTKVERIRSLGTVTNSPRLSVPIDQVSSTRFRFASGAFSSSVSVVPGDGSFTFLSSGEVEISSTTGNVNFSSSDVLAGGLVYEVFKGTQGVNYRMSPDLGLIQFTERLLALDEVLVTYASALDPTVYIEERGTFLVRKEVTIHATPSSTIPFNPSGRTVSSIPQPSVFRGGRPQSTSQVKVDTSQSLISFLPDILPTPGGATSITDALPHGAIVDPSERVYIDYYIYEALGGENTITVLNPPINLAQVSVVEDKTVLEISGDWTVEFEPNRLLRVGPDQLYYITSVSYDGTKTTLTISQPFRDSANDPKVYTTSGDIRITSSGSFPSYFVMESSYFPVPRGATTVKIPGDKSSTYQAGTVLYLSGLGYSDFYLVTGSKYSADTGRTEVSFTQGAARQYNSTSFTFRRSVRPIYESTSTTVQTSGTPFVVAPSKDVASAVLVFRQVEGQSGVILVSPDDFKIDDAGKVTLASPLLPAEEVSIFYTKYQTVNPGQLRASYTANIAPTEENGLLNQKLSSSYTTYIPDSFYFRVETMTNFRSEVAEDYKDEALASSPSGGPRTSNAAQLKLFEQGSESVFFTEGHLANEDIIARATLQQYNDAVNYLEDLLRNLDGRVVGDYDGKFKFDGTTGSIRSSFEDADNQIDDKFKISDFPIDTTPPLFPIKFKGTYLKAYEASASSRFYPTYRNKFGYTVGGDDTGAKTGDAILDFELKPLTGSKPTADRRTPRAVLTRSAKAGDSTIYVDTTAQVDTPPYRPAFANGMKVVIQDPGGSFYVSQGSALTIQAKTSTSITFTAGVPAAIPLGSSVYLADSDTAYRKSYRIGFDVTLDVDKGFLLYVKPYPPFDGSVPAVPAELAVQAPDSNELLEAGLYLNNKLTAPDRFPALDGGAFDDDGDQRLPLINPTHERELGSPGYLETELAYISPSGLLLSNSVSPYTGTGNLSGGGTVVTLTSGTFPSPVPQVGDLVRTLSGVNGASSFRRVTAVSSNSVTTDVAFTSDTGFSFLVTTAANLRTGTFTTISGVVVTDTTANFITAGVKPGHTVVITQVGHGSYLQRRQVKSIDSATQITLTAAFTVTTFPVTYRIHNPLDTYSEVGDLPSSPAGLLGVLQSNSDSEVASIDNFFSTVLTNRLSPSTATGSVASTTLTGAGVDFVSSGVQAGDFVYVTPTQSNQGFYKVAEVTGTTTLKVSSAFPSAGSVSFRVVSSFGVAEKSLVDLFDVRSNAVSFYNATVPWSTLASSVVPVLVPPGTADSTYFARGYTSSDFSARVATVNTRKTYVTSAIPKVTAVLASSDRLYDKRYVWIDARINLEKGILVKQERAVSNRIKAQEDTLKQLTKLLAVES